MFGNPVAGTIRSFGIPGPGFGVTAPFGVLDAFHPTPHGGVDIGNGKCGEPLLAMSTGRITLAGKVPGSDALIIRGIDPAQPDYEWAVAHCASIAVKVNQIVLRGDVIGVLGKTGTTACHCHIGLKIRGVSSDVWPLLDQNMEDALDPSFSPKPNTTVTVKQGARHRLAPTTADPANVAIANDAGGPLVHALLGTVVGQAIAGNAIWYVYWQPAVSKLYYLHTSACGPEYPWDVSDCTQPVKDAVEDAKAAIRARVTAALA